LTATARLGNPLLATLEPIQKQCNYVTLLFRNLSSMFSESIGVGTFARVSPLLPPPGPNSEGFPSAVPANGPSTQVEKSGQLVDNNHIHYNPYPRVANCEAGKEEYGEVGARIGNASSVSGNNTEITHRGDNRFGEAYLRSVRRALGLKIKPKKTSKGKSKKGAKGNAKKKSAKGKSKNGGKK
ncbi:MAG: hypothetical protein ACYCU0_13205, partial [Solirubrobacteraceae bacterium]